jgi:CheY-like chemotaxis protein
MPSQNKTLLIIEDDPIYAGFISSSITDSRLPVNLHHVSTVEAALAYLRGEPPYDDRLAYPLPAIVLLDLNLVQQRGFPVLTYLRENGHLEKGKVRVVMLTASSNPKDLDEAMQSGATSYLIKSPIRSTIIQLVGKFVQN